MLKVEIDFGSNTDRQYWSGLTMLYIHYMQGVVESVC